MKTSVVELTLREFTDILKDAVKTKLGFDPTEIHIMSYDKPRCVIYYDSTDPMVEMITLLHRAR